MSGRYDLICEQGSTFSKSIRLSNASGPIDLTEFSARMQVRVEVDDEEYILFLIEGDGIEIEPLIGRITMSISAEDTAALPRDGVYDLEIIDGADQAHRLLQGKFELDLEVTRDA